MIICMLRTVVRSAFAEQIDLPNVIMQSSEIPRLPPFSLMRAFSWRLEHLCPYPPMTQYDGATFIFIGLSELGYFTLLGTSCGSSAEINTHRRIHVSFMNLLVTSDALCSHFMITWFGGCSILKFNSLVATLYGRP